jgi:hypothetical protein
MPGTHHRGAVARKTDTTSCISAIESLSAVGLAPSEDLSPLGTATAHNHGGKPRRRTSPRSGDDLDHLSELHEGAVAKA